MELGDHVYESSQQDINIHQHPRYRHLARQPMYFAQQSSVYPCITIFGKAISKTTRRSGPTRGISKQKLKAAISIPPCLHTADACTPA